MIKLKHFITRNYKKLKFEISYKWSHNVIRDSYRYVTYTFWERLFRSIAFFKVGWLNYDFDNSSIHQLLLFRLKRLERCFIDHGNHSPDCPNYKPKMKSIRLAIKLLERYCSDEGYDYYHKPMERHEAEWGIGELKWEPADVDEDGYVRSFKSVREHNGDPKDKRRDKSLFAAFRRSEEREDRDIQLVHKIIAKYYRHWWD